MDFEAIKMAMRSALQQAGAAALTELLQLDALGPQAWQLTLPIPLGPRISILYVEMDGTGLPVVGKETEGRAGKQDGQAAHTREAKLGCVFTQTKVDEEGYPLRDEDSTTYVGAIESAEEFGRRLYARNGCAIPNFVSRDFSWAPE